MSILITGAAGFIGFHLSKSLLENGEQVIGFDSVNNYYDARLKEDRLAILSNFRHFTFIKGDLSDKKSIDSLFEEFTPDFVINLAAQAGVRYSIDNPQAYIDSNIVGFLNILEACRYSNPKHLIYASSSSVYGNQQKTPFSETDIVDFPVSLYAATKKSNELMAFTYSNMFGINTTGLRFFTVYGPWGRPDMAYYSFTKKILAGDPIKIFNNGELSRDFTYVDDIVNGILNLLSIQPKRYKIYNLGNRNPKSILYFIEALECALGVKAKKEFVPMQKGDVFQTFADIVEAEKDFSYNPSTDIETGLDKFVKWYRDYKNGYENS